MPAKEDRRWSPVMKSSPDSGARGLEAGTAGNSQGGWAVPQGEQPFPRRSGRRERGPARSPAPHGPSSVPPGASRRKQKPFSFPLFLMKKTPKGVAPSLPGRLNPVILIFGCHPWGLGVLLTSGRERPGVLHPAGHKAPPPHRELSGSKPPQCREGRAPASTIPDSPHVQPVAPSNSSWTPEGTRNSPSKLDGTLPTFSLPS